MGKDHISPDTVPFDRTGRDLGVIVGYDGSEHGIRALRYAAQAAGRLEAPLTVISAFTVPAAFYTTASAVAIEPENLSRERIAEEILDEARERLADYPGAVTYRAEHGDPAGVLVDLSEHAIMAVVGARGRGGFLGRILGSVSSALPAHAHCPTVVVSRDDVPGSADGFDDAHAPEDRAPVVVGVDGSSRSRLAALHAAFTAHARDTGLELLLSLPSPVGMSAWYPEQIPDMEVIERRTAELTHELEAEAAWLRERYPGLRTTVRVEEGDPAEILSERSGTAQLTVLGTRGHGRFVSALLGSISRAVLARAKGPVMVVPSALDASPDRPGLDG